MSNNKFFAAAALCLLAAASAFGQGRTVVSGTVTDATGVPYSGASLSINLTTPTGTIGAYLNGAQIGSSVGPVLLDSTGSFLVQLADNTLVQCANAAGQIVACAPQTQWAFAVTLSPGVARPVGTGAQTCNSTITISGASQSVSTNFSGCPNLTTIGGSGGSSTPASQAGGSCTAAAVLPGQACMGPTLLPNGAAPTFEVAYSNTNSVQTTSYSVAGSPLAAPSLAVLINSNSQGAATNAPDGTWTLVDDQHSGLTYEIFDKTVSTVASVNAAGTMAANGSFNAMLAFFGGNITSTPHTATSSTVTCSAPSDNCATATIGPVSASNMLLMVGRFTGSGANVAQSATVTDNAGNQWQKIYATQTAGASPQSLAVWIVQNPIAATPVITIDGNTSAVIIGGCCKVYEFAGLTGYYSGSTGPPGFRYITPQDLTFAGFPPTATIAATDVQANQAANLGPRTLTTVPKSGFYRASCYLVITQAATTSATLPQCVVQYTDFDSNTVEPNIALSSPVAVNSVGINSFSNPGTTVIGQGVFYAKAGVAITWSTLGYASTGATPMQYAARIKLEFLGQ